MKTYQFKTKLFDYFSEKIVEEFPELSGKIFRHRLKVDKPDYPFVSIKSEERTRINKRFESFYSENSEFVRAQYRIKVTFSVHTLKASPIEAEMYADNLSDYIESFFKDCEFVHSDFAAEGIVINEILSSGVKEISNFLNTGLEFVREIDIVFEFEDLISVPSVLGKELDTNIVVKD